MRKTRGPLACALFIAIVCVAAQTAHASMIGDTLTINRLFPDLLTHFAPAVSTVVQAGPADAVSPQATLYTINPEANNILIDFIASSGFWDQPGPFPFDGLQFLGFSEDIESVAVVQATGISVAELDFGDDFINLNLEGLFDANSFLNLEVVFAQSQEVPEPGALSLLAVGFAALVTLRRYLK